MSNLQTLYIKLLTCVNELIKITWSDYGGNMNIKELVAAYDEIDCHM